MRRRRRRNINKNFKNVYFKPVGIPLRELDEKVINHDELEVLRLRYIKGLNQTEAAKKMGVSQSQYQRDLRRVMKKITEALMKHEALRVEEGK